jgi:hypothetical protein
MQFDDIKKQLPFTISKVHELIIALKNNKGGAV